MDHLKKFKNNALDQEEMRRRRANVTVELRKNKKDESLLKRRNCQNTEIEPLSDEEDPETESNQILKNYNSISDNLKANFFYNIVQSAKSSNPEERLVTIKSVRKLLSSFKNPPIDELIQSGIMPVLVQNLADNQHSAIQFEVAWALTNIASGNSDQTNAVVQHGAVPIFIKLLESDIMSLTEQVVWALGN